MIYRELNGHSVSLLGFGTMRLPMKEGKIDEERTALMIDKAIGAGVNYFDTAYPYHEGLSEVVVGKILSRYPRDSYYLADKFPGHQIMKHYDPREVFEEQLRKCGVDYFDFYLLHNLCEKSMEVYTDKSLGIIDYFREQKRLGRIKHLGFSTHARPDTLREFLDKYGDCMEFCQIQINYLDDTLQNAREKYNMLTERGIPVIVMEPVRGGKLASLPERDEELLRSLRPDASIASWAFRWLMELDNVSVILSGMSNEEQLSDNIATFSEDKPLSKSERDALFEIAERMKNTVPCTGCRYCVATCPMGLDIPTLIGVYNELNYSISVNASMLVEFLPEDKKPAACIGCGACSRMCPQGIDIPEVMRKLSALIEKAPSWRAICREREENAERLRRGENKNDT